MTSYHDLDEWRRDIRAMTELDRQFGCGHTGNNGQCNYCGEMADE